MESIVQTVWTTAMESIMNIQTALLYTFIVRWIFPLLAVIIFVRLLLPLFRGGSEDKILGYLAIENNFRLPIFRWENSIGRSKLSDVVVNLPFVSRSHAVLSYITNSWQIIDLASKGGVAVNGETVVHSQCVEYGDQISFGGAAFQFLEPEKDASIKNNHSRLQKLTQWSHGFQPFQTFVMILVFQVLGTLQLSLFVADEVKSMLIYAIPIYMLGESVFILALMQFSKKSLELELFLVFLCGLNLFVVGSAAPSHMKIQIGAIFIGMIGYLVLQWIIKDLNRGRKLKYVLVVGALILIMLNLLIGEARFGAKNWINLGFITFQPMEFIKIAFVLAGTATLDKLLTARNLTAFLTFSGVCIGALVLMHDLGTSVIFFVSFLVISFMRSGDVRTIAIICSGAVIGAIGVVSFLPYIASRFHAYRHVWEFADSIGYQQTRTLISAASGGLLGVGGGRGFLTGIPAADTDLVFGLLCEEWGFIVAIVSVLILISFAFYALFLMKSCKSSFYVISACGASSILLTQTALNVFGSLDLLPLTGVTLPFVSNGGSSMVACWALAAFIKSADNRGGK